MKKQSERKFEVWGTRDCHLNMAYYWPRAEVFGLKRFLGKGYSHAFVYFEGEVMTWCEDFGELRDIGRYLLEKFLKDSKKLDIIYHQWRKEMDRFLQRAKELNKTDFTRMSNRDLLKVYQEVVALNSQSPLGYFTDIMQMFLQGEAQAMLGQYISNGDPKFNTYYAAITAADTLSFVAREELALLQIAKKAINGRHLLDKLLDQHTERYFWLGGNYTGQGFLNKEYFSRRIKPLLRKRGKILEREIAKIKALPQKAKQEKARVIWALKLNAESVKVIRILEKIIAYHDERKETILAPVFYLMPLEKAIAGRFGLKRDELVWLTPQEVIRSLMTGKIDKEKIKRRSQKCAFYCDNKKEIIITGKAADALFNKLVTREIEQEIKGTVANPGQATGVVRVIKSIKEIDRVKKGDILVCGMTTPDFITGLKKAAAVITDEGGITCHAAIISRELGIPCIIGAKVATKVLKDGDIVEVDANRGVVRVVNMAGN